MLSSNYELNSYILCFKLYTQKGAALDFQLAIDITPSNWHFSPDSNSHFTKTHFKGQILPFLGGQVEVVIPERVCGDNGVDHLFLVVESTRLPECLLYNNYIAVPIQCKLMKGIDYVS